MARLLSLACTLSLIVATGDDSGSAVENRPKPGEMREFEIAADVKMKFCWIPAGESQLGSPQKEQESISKRYYDGKRPEWLDAESELHRGKFVSKGFWLGKYLVTQGEWRAVMGTNPSAFSERGYKKRNVAGTDTTRFPVEQVSWDDCGSFLDKINHRNGGEMVFGKRGKFALPNENEWEYACRGGLGNARAYCFGDSLNGRMANCDGRFPFGTVSEGPYLERTTEVGAYEKEVSHPWGLCDMHGNVMQWCENRYSGDNQFHVLRGGDWSSAAGSCRAAARSCLMSDRADSRCGFRVCIRPD